MFDTAIGAVIHNDVLTMAIRRGDVLDEPIQHSLGHVLEAAALLLEQRVRHRHDDPVIYLEAGAMAGAVLEEIRRLDEHSRDQIVDGLSAALSLAGAGVGFYDRRSELHYRLRERVARGELLIPAPYTEQLAAFGGERGEIKSGNVFFPHVADVTTKLGRFPALAVAAVLAAIPVPPPGDLAKRDYNPYARARRGDRGARRAPGGFGHNPYAKARR